MKYAVLESGGKQYIAREGETLDVDRLPMEVGQALELGNVLLVVDDDKVHVGAPYVKGAKVKVEVVDQFKAPKVIVFKYIPKERYRRKQGHRQRYTRVAINTISLPTPRKKTAAPEESEKPKETKSTPRAKAKPKKTASVKKPKEPKASSGRRTKSTKSTGTTKKKQTKPTTKSKAKKSEKK